MRKVTLSIFLGLFTSLSVSAQNEGRRPTIDAANHLAEMSLERQIQSLILPTFSLKNASFGDAIKYLSFSAYKQSNGQVNIAFDVRLPKEFKPQNELTLDLNGIPCSVALDYLGRLAGVRFGVESASVTVTPARAERNLSVAEPPSEAPKSAAPSRLTGESRLSEKAQPTFRGKGIRRSMNGEITSQSRAKNIHRQANGDVLSQGGGKNIHRNTNGQIQSHKSGYIAHRNLSGWSVTIDPTGRIGVNCHKSPPCMNTCTCR